jgi:hypothetical protein
MKSKTFWIVNYCLSVFCDVLIGVFTFCVYVSVKGSSFGVEPSTKPCEGFFVLSSVSLVLWVLAFLFDVIRILEISASKSEADFVPMGAFFTSEVMIFSHWCDLFLLFFPLFMGFTYEGLCRDDCSKIYSGFLFYFSFVKMWTISQPETEKEY